MKKWQWIEDSDGHRWLVRPSDGEYVACFTPELGKEAADEIVLALNAVEELLLAMKGKSNAQH